MKDFSGLNLNDCELPPLARNLIERLCSLQPTNRYRVEQALRHPWITGNPRDEIPLTNEGRLTKDLTGFELADKLRRTLNTVLFISIVRNNDSQNTLSSTRAKQSKRITTSTSFEFDYSTESLNKMI